MKCVNCGYENEEDSVFCTQCGENLKEQKRESEPANAGSVEPEILVRAEGVSQEAFAELQKAVEALEQEVWRLQNANKSAQEELRGLRDSLRGLEERLGKAESGIGKICPSCGSAVRGDMIYCNICGTKL